MSSPSVAGFLAAIESIRDQPQPYSALSDYLASMTVTFRWKNGIQVIPYSTISLNLLLLSTAASMCLIKIRSKTFNLGSLTQDFILRPNSAICFALGCIVFSILSVTETAVWISGTHSKGINNLHGRAALGGIKFVFLWEGAWCFSWSSAGLYICSKWRPPWQPVDRHTRIPALVVWCLNTTFIVTALVALLFPLITFTMVELRAQDLLSSVASVCMRLRSLDENRVVKFDFFKAMTILSPLLQTLPTLVSIVNLIRKGVIAWFCVVILILLLQLIFICLAFVQRRVLRPDDGLWTTIERIFIYKTNTLSAINSSQKSAFNYAREQSVIIMISFIILVSGTAFMPVLIMQYRTATLEHIAGVTGQLMTDLISTFVASAIANVLMIMILLQTLRFSNAKHRPENETTVRSEAFSMRLSSKHLSVQPPYENGSHRSSVPSFEDPEKTISTDFEQWKQDAVSIEINCADEASEMNLVESTLAVR